MWKSSNVSQFLAVSMSCFVRSHASSSVPTDDQPYYLIGVSGGLQDGFPDHNKLDFHSGKADESRAIFLGKTLVRGYKAYLDVMQDGWRQYTPEPGQPLINSVVVPSGCKDHANEFWVYIVDARQVMSVLANEPRFLSITPDTGLVDLTAAETSPTVRHFARQQIKLQGRTDMDRFALPIVTAVWYHESFIPSPPIHVKNDGTEVTNFPESLALWAGVSDKDRTDMCDEGTECSPEAQKAHGRYWSGIRKAVRNAEANRLTREESEANGPPFKCKEKTRFGVGPETARVNTPFSAKEILEVLKDIGFSIDFVAGELIQLDEATQ